MLPRRCYIINSFEINSPFLFPFPLPSPSTSLFLKLVLTLQSPFTVFKLMFHLITIRWHFKNNISSGRQYNISPGSIFSGSIFNQSWKPTFSLHKEPSNHLRTVSYSFIKLHWLNYSLIRKYDKNIIDYYILKVRF